MKYLLVPGIAQGLHRTSGGQYYNGAHFADDKVEAWREWLTLLGSWDAAMWKPGWQADEKI